MQKAHGFSKIYKELKFYFAYEDMDVAIFY
jgi:hypothetical protein